MAAGNAERSVAHATFSVERVYPATPDRVFAAFADAERKRRWFVEGEGWIVDEFVLDFRVGGTERSRFRFRDGPPMTNDTVFLDIVPDRRIIFAYSMTMDGVPISVSLATADITHAGGGTRLVLTEQAVFLDGYDGAADREGGWSELLGKLGEELRDHP